MNFKSFTVQISSNSCCHRKRLSLYVDIILQNWSECGAFSWELQTTLNQNQNSLIIPENMWSQLLEAVRTVTD